MQLEVAGALLVKGRYRSAAAYFQAIKRMHVQQHVLVAKDVERAAKRGQGRSRQAQPLPVEEIVRAEASMRARAGWPRAPIPVVIITCAWLVREIEAGAAMIKDVAIFEPTVTSDGCGWVLWTLPASKNDTAAEGETRSLGCAWPSALCPVRAMRSVVLATLSQGGGPESPLISTSDGKPVGKKQVVQFYREVVEACGLTVGYFTGHSPRVTGAMRMALSGHSAWVIQLFGRWGSDIVLRFVREALLGQKGGGLSRITEGTKFCHRLNVARGIPITGVHGRQMDIAAMESLALGSVKGEERRQARHALG